MAHYFVWYRLSETTGGDPGADGSAFRIAIDAVLADVRSRTGVAGKLLVRSALDGKPERSDGRGLPTRSDGRGLPTRSDGVATWMEVYDDVADPVAFERELAAAVRRHDIARFVPEGDRHIEAFVAPE